MNRGKDVRVAAMANVFAERIGTARPQLIAIDDVAITAARQCSAFSVRPARLRRVWPEILATST